MKVLIDKTNGLRVGDEVALGYTHGTVTGGEYDRHDGRWLVEVVWETGVIDTVTDLDNLSLIRR
jgi:hypothetical protein